MPRSIPCVPTLFDPQIKNEWLAINNLKHKKHTRVIDTLRVQFEELFMIRHPRTVKTGHSKREVADFISSFLPKGKNIDVFGIWAWYPWISTLIHFLPEDLHTELGTSRNRNLITKDEQDKYYAAHVGIAGLSVGNAVVSSIVHTGGAKYLRIADCDIVSGSNINRIRVGFDAVGVSKCFLAAREVALVNPYTSFTIYSSGLTSNNIEQFLTKPTRLTVVIDEMDSLYLKIQLRFVARKFRIPVIMATDNGDGIVVDIERFDKNPTAPLMHGQVPEKELFAIQPDTPRLMAAKIISRWVKPKNITERMQTSLLALGDTLYTWPQLGNAAFMAGAVLSYVTRNISIGFPMKEGKIVVSPDALFIPSYGGSIMRTHRAKQTAYFRKVIGL